MALRGEIERAEILRVDTIRPSAWFGDRDRRCRGCRDLRRYDTKTLKRTRNRDAVLQDVNPGLPGFALANEKGNWSGFDVDFCRAIAAAIFDDPNKVKFIPLDASERFTELQKRKVDVLSRNSTWNMARETNYGLHFAAVCCYDGQGFIVRRSRNANSGLELDGRSPVPLTRPRSSTSRVISARITSSSRKSSSRNKTRCSRLRLQPVRCADGRRVPAIRDAFAARAARRACDLAGRHLEGASSRPWCGRRTTIGS